MTCPTEYCISGTTIYDDNYTEAGTYLFYPYYTGSNGTYVIYFSSSENRWCVSTSLGGSCDLFGPPSCNFDSPCPNLCDTFFFNGYCVVSPTTTTLESCGIIDFDAYFNCDVPVSPTPTPSITPTITPTPTPTASNVCNVLDFTAGGITYTPTPTPTISNTPMPTPTPTNECFVGGLVTFNIIDDYIRCSNSKKFVDCFTGKDYYTSELLLLSGQTPNEGYVYELIINNKTVCASFVGLVDNISGVDNIEIVREIGLSSQGACIQCVPIQSNTPTPTITPTPTPTPTQSIPCFECKTVSNLPQPGNSIVINGVTLSATGTGSIEEGIFGGFLPYCVGEPAVMDGYLSLGSNSLNPTANPNPFNYTLTFGSPVNNVVIRLLGYEYVSPTVFESFRFVTNGGGVTITSCEYCCAEIIDTLIKATPCNDPIHGNTIGGGVFKITSPSSYTTLTILGDNPPILGGTAVDICDVSITPSVPVQPIP
jgi:hypothetical protein